MGRVGRKYVEMVLFFHPPFRSSSATDPPQENQLDDFSHTSYTNGIGFLQVPEGVVMPKDGMRLKLLWFGVLITFILPLPLLANEDSQMLVGVGLKHLNEGIYDQAVLRFSEALEKDPRDQIAVFYAMYAHIQRGEPEVALNVYNRYNPTSPDTLYLRGVASFLLNRLPEAQKDLMRFYGEAVTPGAPSYRQGVALSAAYYLGVIAYMQNRFSDAQAYLLRAKGLDPALEPYRLLYLGLTHLALNQKEKAEEHLALLKQEYSRSPARELMEEALTGAMPKAKGWFFNAQLFEQYDSNPALVQSDLAVASIYHPELTETTGGVRTNLLLGLGVKTGGGASGTPGLYARAEINGYGGFHHLNPGLKPFNLLTPQVVAAFGYGWEKLTLELPLSYRRIYLGGGPWSFYNQQLGGALNGSLSVAPNWFLRPGVSYARQDFGKGNERTGNELALPLGVVYQYGRLAIQGGYTFSSYTSLVRNSPWGYRSHTLQVSPAFRLARPLTAFLQGQYTFRSFPNPFLFPNPAGTALSKHRRDSEVSLGLGTQVTPGAGIFLLGSYQGVFNNSIPEFSYSRHMVTLSLGVQL